VNLGYPINSEDEEMGMIVDRSGKYGYYASRRTGGMGESDIYRFELYDEIKPTAVSYVRGVVYDAQTKNKIGTTLELTDLATGQVVSSVNSSRNTGEYLVILKSNHNYMLSVDLQDYLYFSENFKLEQHDRLKPYQVDVPLQKPEKDVEVKLSNVFFDTDKYDLKPESKIELEKLVNLLKKFPFMVIEIGGHTDNTGSIEKNETLSLQRAKAVKDYLLNAGIDSNRLSARGYADTKPVADNSTPEGRARNRRTVFKIITVK
jgi:outer membrane protein OmpA-like peptidoglycan-associated protein